MIKAKLNNRVIDFPSLDILYYKILSIRKKKDVLIQVADDNYYVPYDCGKNYVRNIVVRLMYHTYNEGKAAPKCPTYVFFRNDVIKIIRWRFTDVKESKHIVDSISDLSFTRLLDVLSRVKFNLVERGMDSLYLISDKPMAANKRFQLEMGVGSNLGLAPEELIYIMVKMWLKSYNKIAPRVSAREVVEILDYVNYHSPNSLYLLKTVLKVLPKDVVDSAIGMLRNRISFISDITFDVVGNKYMKSLDYQEERDMLEDEEEVLVEVVI